MTGAHAYQVEVQGQSEFIDAKATMTKTLLVLLKACLPSKM